MALKFPSLASPRLLQQQIQTEDLLCTRPCSQLPGMLSTVAEKVPKSLCRSIKKMEVGWAGQGL